MALPTAKKIMKLHQQYHLQNSATPDQTVTLFEILTHLAYRANGNKL